MRVALAATCLLAAPAFAQSLAVVVMDAQGVSEATQRKAHAAAVSALKALSALPVDAEWKGSPRRGCPLVDLGCQRERARASGAPGVVGLWLKGDDASVGLWLDGDRVGDVIEGADKDVRALVEALLPSWARKGWGGVRFSEELPKGSVLKLDGKVLTGKRQAVVSVPAGAHELDVLFPDGSALLQRIEVPEGTRTRVDATPPTPLGPAASRGPTPLRIASYITWMAGAASLLTAFSIQFAGRTSALGQSPCTVDSRECVTYAMAVERQQLAQVDAVFANVFFCVGLVLALAGAALFGFDLWRTK